MMCAVVVVARSEDVRVTQHKQHVEACKELGD